MRSSESVGVYAPRLVNVDSRSSRCHDVARTRTRSCTHLKERGRPGSLSNPHRPSLPIRTRSLLRSPFLFLTFFSPATSVHPLSIRARRRFTYTRAHTPGLTLSATTSVLHSKALTSETSASTSGGRIYRIFFPRSQRGEGGRRKILTAIVERERGVIIASKRIFTTISRFQDCVVKIVPRRVLAEANFASKGGCLLNA